MKYIDYVNDWFSLYINPVDYVGNSALFIKHIFSTVPFLDKIPEDPELQALKEVVTVNAQILIQIIEEENKKDAAAAFTTLKDQIIRLKNRAVKYALNHFNQLCANDPFYKKCQEYLKNTVQGLTAKEQQAIKEAYLLMRMEELCLERTCQLAQKDHLNDLVTQTEMDKLSIDVEKFRCIGKIRSIILASSAGAAQLKQAISTHLLSFFEKVEHHTSFKAKYDQGYLQRQINEFVAMQFNQLQALEKINTEIKVDELSTQVLLTQEKQKHRSRKNLELIREQIASKRQKISINQAIAISVKQEIEKSFVELCQNILRFPVVDALDEVVTLFDLQNFLAKKPKQKDLFKRLTGLFKLVSATFERFLPSPMDLQLGAAGVATGAIVLGANPLGLTSGLGIGAAAIQANHTIKNVTHEINQEWQACIQVFKGRFSSQYRGTAYQMTEALQRVCDYDPVKANVINAFYVKNIFKCELRLVSSSGDEDSASVIHLREMKAQLTKHYQQLREGKVKAKEFWEKTFKEDIALRVSELQALAQQHINAYLLCLYEGAASEEQHFHNNRLLGIQDELKELKGLADKNALRAIRENDTALYRTLIKTPLEYDFEDHVAQLVYHHTPAYLVFWLSEQAANPGKDLAKPLPHFQGKTFWHLLAECSDGDLLMQKMLTVQEATQPSRFGAKVLQKIATLFMPSKNKELFNYTMCYQDMNPLAYAFLHRRVSLLRLYLEEMLAHPSKAQKIGIKNVFAFVLKEFPELTSVLEALKPQGFRAFTDSLPFAQGGSLEMAILAGLTLYVAKEGSLPKTQSAWQALLSELRHSPSAYIQVKVLKDYDHKQIDALAKKCLAAQLPLLPLEASNDKMIPSAKQPKLIKNPKVLLLRYQADREMLANQAGAKGKKRRRKKF
ncbi:MAG: hypothetical protein AB7I18_08440 [Candidatus Berkiella sp.]